MAIHQEPIDYIDILAPPKERYTVMLTGEDNNFRRAIYILMGYESGINYRRVAHILTASSEPNGLSDFDLVQAAAKKLKERNQI
ncbi:hypothetical protein KM915_03630 [Cytobacillus oceanisediminis]|uniref:hypothetical protein n=1 Tax=Cytobacillus oceanisediminis TaxID=665099 RepID=UPI001C2440CF|nr:hypothetical protein [Cytobacillus oceanisediminis]MBU8729146.1 hypothetical protein [Cytobacillus oceanisediminis]